MAKHTSSHIGKAALISLACRLAQSHMILLTPTPFNNETIASDPLHSSGSNFPCQNTGASGFYNSAGISNPMTVGQPQTLSFRGSATHGGGSCQLAITTDKAPTAATKWEVIFSIEGGCPTTDDQPSGSTYQYAIPEGTSPGDYVLAWTWISKLAGQPEYYMNCAPIQVSGGNGNGNGNSTKHAAPAKRASLPNLAVFNLARINDCKTTPETDPVYEDPGPNLLRPSGASRSFAKPSGTNCFPLGAAVNSGTASASVAGSASTPSAGFSTPSPSAASPNAGAASTSIAGSGSSPNAGLYTPSLAAASSPSTESGSATGANDGSAPTSPPPSPIATPLGIPTSSTAGSPSAGSTSTLPSLSFPVISPTLYATPSSSASAAAPSLASSSPSAAAVSSPALTPSPAAASSYSTTPTSPPSPSSSSAVSTTGGLSGPCTNEGIWNCIGGNSFQRCASGQWTAVQPMAAGTSCQTGQSTTLWARSRFSRRWLLTYRGIL